MNPETQKQIEELVKSARVVLFMKGSRSFPQCGFSSTVVQILNTLVPEYKTVNVLADPAVREGVKEYSSWPTIPQLYVDGEFVGGCDIVKEMFASGDLHTKLGVERKEVPPPKLTVTPPAAEALRGALADAGPDDHVRVSISPGFQHDLELGPPRGGDLKVQAGGLTLLVDPMSAPRAEGLVIDFVSGPDGAGFRLDNPNAPPAVRPISPRELEQRMKSGPPIELFDTRTPDERVRASIPGARVLDEAALAHIEGLDKSTPIAFHCHHGTRSRTIAQRFIDLGFTQVYNLAGGIDQWSRDVDPNVPRY
jgi:monothiol glutaredoxin